MQELLDCVVSPDWALALSGVGHIQVRRLQHGHVAAGCSCRRAAAAAGSPLCTALRTLQASSLARTDLWQEALLLEKLLYKNSNQHHSSLHYQRLLEVGERPLKWGGG